MPKLITSLTGLLGCMIAGPALAQVAQPAMGQGGASDAPLVGSTVDQSQILPNSVTTDNLRSQREATAGSSNRSSSTRRAVAATAADLVAGAAVSDKAGQPLGKIDSVGTDGVVLATADGGKVAVPANAFGKTSKGLLLGITKAQFATLANGAK